MVSGKYSALSGAVAREQAMANISNNLANINSTGFRKNRISFEALLRGDRQRQTAKGINYSRIGKIINDFSQGAIRQTGRSLDVAISGEGFFKIRRGDAIFYTRNGNFFTDVNGMLKTADGDNVLDASSQPIQLPDIQGKKIVIDEQGAIYLDNIPSGQKIQVFTVKDTKQLQKIGNALFQGSAPGGDRPSEDARIVQFSLEESNVNMVEEMTLMIDTQRKFEMYAKVLKAYSTLSEKESELGTVG